jgi:hypothetical protein
MRNSTKMGGSIKKKYQAGGSKLDPVKTIDTFKKGAIKNPKMKMNPAKIQVGTTKPMTPAQKIKKIEEFTNSKKQKGGMITQMRRKHLANKYNKLSDKLIPYKNRPINPILMSEDYYSSDDPAKVKAYDAAEKVDNKATKKFLRTANAKGRVTSKMDKIDIRNSFKQKGGVIVASPIDGPRRKVAGSNMAKGGSLKPVNPGANPGLAKLPAPVRNKMGYAKKGGAHPGFKAVQAKIAAKSGVSKAAAGAILAASTRKASAKAKAANPRLKRVK